MLNFITIFHNPLFPIGFDILKVIENSSIILNIIYINRNYPYRLGTKQTHGFISQKKSLLRMK
jgi:hypothetical protein